MSAPAPILMHADPAALGVGVSPARGGGRTKAGGKKRGLKRPPLEPLNTAATQCQKPVFRLSDEERERMLVEQRPRSISAQGEQMSQIQPWLYLGSLADALDPELLIGRGVTHVLNTAKECESAGTPETSPGTPLSGAECSTYLKLELLDHSDEPIAAVFARAFEFIDRAKCAGGKVLVHCRRGISRSATLTIAYLMQSEGMPLNAAYDFVLRRRPIINPNLGFVLSLESFHQQLASRQQLLPQGLLPMPVHVQAAARLPEEEAVRRILSGATESPSTGGAFAAAVTTGATACCA